MFSIFSYSKSVDNLENLVSPTNKNPIIHLLYFQLLILILQFYLFFLLLLILIFIFKKNGTVFNKIHILVLNLLNLHLTFIRYRLFHHQTCSIFFVIHFLFHYFLVLSMVTVFISFNIFFKSFSSSLNYSIIIYVFESAKELIVPSDLVSKYFICLLVIQQSFIQYQNSLIKIAVFQKVN